MAEDDAKYLKKLNHYWEEGKRFREVASKDWDSNPDMLKGDQLPPSRPPHKPPAVLNKLRSVAERKIALMTDTKPKFEVTPNKQGTGFTGMAAILKDTSDAWWDDTSQDQNIARGLYFPINFGNMIVQTRWSKTQQDIILDMIDPRRFVFDPHVPSPMELHRAEYCVWEEFPPIEELKMLYPDKAGKINAWKRPAGTWQQAREMFSRMFAGGGTSPVKREQEQADAVPRAWVRHYWLRDYSTDKREVVDKKGESHDVYKRKFPGGRYVITAGENTILHDEPNPYWDGQHPFDMMDWYVDVDSSWGLSEISALKNPQVLYNKVIEVITENGMLMNNAMWICDYNAFDVDDWKQLTNVPGGIIKKRPGTEVRREYPNGIPGTILQLAQYLEGFIEKEPGIHELTGKKPGQVQSGIGIESLQMLAAAMIRIKARALESLLQRVGQKIISRIIQFYTDDRVLHSIGPEGKFKEYVFIRKNFSEALSAQALRDAHRDFRFRVIPGSSLSMQKTQKALVYAELFKMGAVDEQCVLEALEIPDWKNILARVEAKKAAGLMGQPGGQKGKKGGAQRQVAIAGRI